MKAAQITKYSKNIEIEINDIKKPEVKENAVLIKTKAAAVNPLELLISSGSIRLIHDYSFPLTIGNEVSGVVEEVGDKVVGFKVGDEVYGRLPISQIGGIAEYVAVDASAIWHLPSNLDFIHAAAAPLTGLTAYQALHEELNAKAGETVLIPGGSGSFGQMAVPIAKAMGLKVIVSGNARVRDEMLRMGVDQYIDYKVENYWDKLTDIDYVIDTLGKNELKREFAVLKKNGIVLSLKAGPNFRFAKDHNLPAWKKALFKAAGMSADKLAKSYDSTYKFIFVRSDGEQLKSITRIIEDRNIVPAIDSRTFSIDETAEALELVANGKLTGKVIISF